MKAPWIWFLASSWIACAAPKPQPVDPAQTLARPAEPDELTARLVEGAGDDASLLAMVHPDAWRGLARVLADADQPWPASAEPWQSLLTLLGPDPAAIQGWDRTRPFAVALVEPEGRGLLAAFDALLWRGEGSPTHLRLLVPSDDPMRLTRSLAELLAKAGGHPAGPGRHVLDLEGGARLDASIVPADRHVRLKLLLYSNREVRVETNPTARLARALDPPRQARNGPSTDPSTRLLANGRGVALRVRPADLARHLILGAVRDLPASVAPEVRDSFRIAGTSLAFDGYLVASTGAPEIDEVVWAFDLDRDIKAVTLVKPTSSGRRALDGLVGKLAKVPATPPDALLAIGVAAGGLDRVAESESLFGAAYRPKDRGELDALTSGVGAGAWLALLARPIGLWRTLADLDRAGDQAAGSTALSFELIGFRARMSPVFRRRGTGAGVGSDSPVDHDVPPGTFCRLKVRPAAIAASMEQQQRKSGYDVPTRLLGLLKSVESVDASLRWQDGWIVGQARGRLSGGTEPSVLALPQLRQADGKDRPHSPNRIHLDRAVVRARELLSSLASIAPGDKLGHFRREQAAVVAGLRPAEQDASLHDEAAALEHMLVELEGMLSGR